MGENMSLGFVTGKVYNVFLTAQPNNRVLLTAIDNGEIKYCIYDNDMLFNIWVEAE